MAYACAFSGVTPAAPAHQNDPHGGVRLVLNPGLSRCYTTRCSGLAVGFVSPLSLLLPVIA